MAIKIERKTVVHTAEEAKALMDQVLAKPRRCLKCGQEVPAGVMNCIHCGSNQQVIKSSSVSVQFGSGLTFSTNSKVKVALIVAGLALLAALLIYLNFSSK